MNASVAKVTKIGQDKYSKVGLTVKNDDAIKWLRRQFVSSCSRNSA